MDLSDLLKAEDSRVFLKLALALQYQKKGKANLSDFSRRAGFSSRSYLSEYLSGKKGLSRDGIQRIVSSLKLPRNYLRIFELLVMREQPELRSRGATTESLEQKLLETKELIQSLSAGASRVRNPRRFYAKTSLLEVFASLGTSKNGAAFAEILHRCKLKPEVVQEALVTLLQEGAAIKKEGRYFAAAAQLDFLGLSANEGLAEVIQEVCERTRNDAARIIDESSNLVLYTTLSVNRSRRAEFKRRLREAVVEILDQFQADDGDAVEKLFIASHF